MSEAFVCDSLSLLGFLQSDRHLPARVKHRFAACDRGEVRIVIPSLVLVELRLLAEQGQIPVELFQQVVYLVEGSENYGVAPLDLRVIDALPATHPDKDLPQRIVDATARALGVPLVTTEGN